MIVLFHIQTDRNQVELMPGVLLARQPRQRFIQGNGKAFHNLSYMQYKCHPTLKSRVGCAMRTIRVLCAAHIPKNYRLTMKAHLPDGSQLCKSNCHPLPGLTPECHTIQGAVNLARNLYDPKKPQFINRPVSFAFSPPLNPLPLAGGEAIALSPFGGELERGSAPLRFKCFFRMMISQVTITLRNRGWKIYPMIGSRCWFWYSCWG